MSQLQKTLLFALVAMLGIGIFSMAALSDFKLSSKTERCWGNASVAVNPSSCGSGSADAVSRTGGAN